MIIAASDGSMSSSIRAYGWTCSLPHGQRLATNHGPVFGRFPSSFHAEAYGLLSYLRFLYRVSQYTQSPLPKQNIIYTDSTSLIEKLGEIRKWPYFFPNTTMDPDWDVLQQIIFSLRLFSSLPEIRFVQGHQDDDHPYTTLSLPAQLNVDADHLAGRYVPSLNENPTIVTMIAGSAVSLHLLSRTITTKYGSALCKAASTDPIQHYIQTKNKWSNDEFASINWIAHSRSVHCFYHKKQFIVKFVHEWLPLGILTSKYKKHHLLTCPTCSHEIEDGEHFLCCTNCPQWKLDMFHALRNYFNKIPTRPFLGDLLITGLSKWLCNELAIFSDFPPIYNSLIFHQRRIGWKQLFVSRFVYEWSDLQQDYLVLQRIVSKKYSGTSWITGVIQIIWKHVYQNWDARNADLHGVDAAMRESAKYAQAQRETEEIYSQCSLVQP